MGSGSVKLCRLAMRTFVRQEGIYMRYQHLAVYVANSLACAHLRWISYIVERNKDIASRLALCPHMILGPRPHRRSEE